MSDLAHSHWSRCCIALIAFLPVLSICGGENAAERFDAGNKLYEEGKFIEAASAYQSLAKSGQASAPVFFNLGNAWFKSGQIGQAIVAYRQAERVSPRDPDVRANLQFARNQVQGPTLRPTFWQRVLGKLTLNEWTTLAASSFWVFLLLLTLLQWRPALKPAFRNYVVVIGFVTAVLCGCLVAVLQQDHSHRNGIIITRDATLRQGPLNESQPVLTLHDGAEVNVLDTKNDWLQVSPDSRRTGWVQRKEIAMLRPPGS